MLHLTVTGTQPEAPSGLNLQSVTANTARLTWARPSDTGIPDVDSYIVQLRRGGEQASWVVKVRGETMWVIKVKGEAK